MQQEKDYLLKSFLFYHYKRFENAVFKGGTSIRYLYGLNRFSEDLDFNLLHSPKKFEKETKSTLKELEHMGVKNKLRKSEHFENAFTCEVEFQGPLFTGERQSLNKFRIDAGRRTGTLLKPRWELISSEYADTPRYFLVKVLDEQELLAEKISALCNRRKGRDLYDAWFLIKMGTKANKKIIRKKLGGTEPKIAVHKKEYGRDMKKLSPGFPEYEQAVKETTAFLKAIQ